MTVWKSNLLYYRHFPDRSLDYLHLTKRFGIIAASQLPCHYLLAIKSPYSPFQYLTGKSHETLNVYHRLLGKAITFLLYLHAIFYVNFYVQKSLLISKLQELYVLCGIFALVAFKVISIPPHKYKSYRIFYTIHITLASLLLPFLFFHVSHLRIYLYESGAIYLCHTLLRSYATTTISGTIKTIPTGTGHDDLIEITIPTSQHTTTAFQPILTYRTAQHTYLSLSRSPLARSINSNPFTLASLPSIDNELRFYARVHAGNTAALAKAAAAATHSPTNDLTLTLEGPYGVQTHPDRLLTYDRILLVAGGIGATFVVPLYRQLLTDLSPSPGSYRREKVRFIWAVRSAEEKAWALPEEGKDGEGLGERAEVFVTGSTGASEREGGGGAGAEEGEEAIELQERTGLLADGSRSQEIHDGSESNGRLHTGRPDLHAVVGETFSHGASERVAVVVCGPKSLSRDLRREVGRWVVGQGREVWFWEESFGT